MRLGINSLLPASPEVFVLSLGLAYAWFSLNIPPFPRFALLGPALFVALMLVFCILEMFDDHRRTAVVARRFLLRLLLIAACVSPALVVAGRYAAWF